jgi:hypothetical protein
VISLLFSSLAEFSVVNSFFLSRWTIVLPVAESGCRSLLFLKENSAYEEKWEGTKFGTRQEPQVEFSVKVAVA